MLNTKAKIYNNTLNNQKEIIEDNKLKENLVAHFQLKGDIKGKGYKNILDYSTWDIGTIGSQTGFSGNGSDSENEIIEGLDPFNKKTQIWKQIPDQTSGPDGGWNSSSFSIDNTKLYRYTVWVKRTGSTNGTTYHGCHGYGSAAGVLNSDNGQNNTNPYFYYSTPPLDEWVLIVGYIHPAGTQVGTKHPDSGVYNIKGEKIQETVRDFIWRQETTSANQRTYLFYCTDTNVRQYFVYPRVDICDGTEPSLEDLIQCEGNITYPSNYKIRYIRDYLNGSTSNTGNHWVQLSAIDWQGNNVQLNKPVTASSGGTNLTKVTDGTTTYSGYASQTSGSEQYVEIDLGYKFDIKRIDLWHYWADGRTYHGTKTLVSQDGNTWFDVRNSIYDGEYKETSEGIKIYINNENITHTTRTDNGLDIDQEKENVVINYNLDDYWSKDYCTDIKWNDIQPPDGIDSDVVSFYDQNDKSGYWFCYGDYQPQTPGTEYTVSLYVKTNDSNFKIKFYTADNSETGRIYGQFKSVPNDGKWHKIVWDSFINPSNSQSDSLSFNFTYGNDPGEGQRTWLCQPQMTQSNFSPGFRKKWRKQGQFRYLLDNYQEYTITGFFTPKTSFSNTLGYGETQNQSQLFRVQDNINSGGFYYRFYMSGSTSAPFLDPDGIYQGGHTHQYYEIDKNKELFFQIRKTGSTVKFKIYQEDWKSEHVMSTNSSQALSEFILGLSTLWNGSFSDLSFYKSYLSDEDINKFVYNKFRINKNGNIQSRKIIEDQNLLYRQGNTQFDTGEFGGIWGRYTQTNCDVQIVKQPYKNYLYSYFIRRQPNIAQSSNWGGLRLSFPDDDMWEEGNTYKVSFKYKGYSKDTIAVYFAYQVGWGTMGVGLSTLGLPSITKNIDDEDGWQYYEGIFTIPSGYIHQVGTDGNTYFCMREFKIGYTYTTTDSIGTRLFINDLRMEKINEDKSFKTGIGQKTNGLYFNTFEENKLNAHIKAIGTQYTSTETFVPTTGNRVLELDGQSIYNTSGRGARLTIFKNDLSVILDTTYDIYGDDQARTNLQNQLNNLQDNEHFVITTYDQINSNQNLNQQFENLNSKIWTTLNSGRSPYQCYGKNKKIIYEDGARYDDYHKHKQVLDFII